MGHYYLLLMIGRLFYFIYFILFSSGYYLLRSYYVPGIVLGVVEVLSQNIANSILYLADEE